MMRHLLFEFPTEKEMRDTVNKLWGPHNLSGELSVHPLPGGKWRVEIYAERDLRESVLEKFASYRVEVE